jgi:hypothetical protein
MKKKNMKTDDPLLEIAEALTRQLSCYVKERKKIGEFDTSEINPDKDGICRRVDVGIEEFSRGNKHVWIFIEFENGTQKGTLFYGTEDKLRVWVKHITEVPVLYEYITDAIKTWGWHNGH